MVFENLGWDQEWIEIARQKFMKVYNQYYAKYEDPGLKNTMVRVGTGFPHGRIHQSDRFSDFNSLVFGPLTEPEHPASANAIAAQYLDGERVERDAVPVDWWRLHAHRFPSLAVIARDYLSVPATRYDLIQGLNALIEVSDLALTDYGDGETVCRQSRLSLLQEILSPKSETG